MRPLNVHPLPEHVAADDLAGGTTVVIDVLRATTTIVFALAAGARAVIPCLAVDDARARAAELPPDETVLAGERGGLPIGGFRLGNSPSEFTPESVAGKTVVMTTTNGTKALLHCRSVDRILIGAFANISALCTVLSECPRVDLVCSGTGDWTTDEDLLMAGAIVERLSADGDWKLDHCAHRVRGGWQSVARDATGGELSSYVATAMRATRGGRNLIEIGMQRDIETAAELDRFTIVPRFDPAAGRVEVDAPSR